MARFSDLPPIQELIVDGRPIIEARNLTCRLGGVDILRGLTFSMREGESISIVGPNGAGKSTLLKCLMRIVPSAGEVVVGGCPLADLPQRELARQISYVPQADSASVPFTVGQFVLMGRYPHLSPFTAIGAADREAVAEALAVTSTRAFEDRDLRTLSGGERQRVLIAAALAQGARVLLLDEPVTYLDPAAAAQVTALIVDLNRRGGVTLVVVTHDLNAAASIGSRVLALRGGLIVFDGTPGDFLDNDVLESVYGRRFLFARHPASGAPVVVPGEAP